jgi:hypothetical protein
MKNIIAAGDSFTWGSDLTDSSTTVYSNNTWAALTASFTNSNYNCAAVPSASNNTIARRTIHFCENSKIKPWLVMVMWTYPHRLETITATIEPKLQHYDNFLTISAWHGFNLDEKHKNWGAMSEGQKSFFAKEHDLFEKIGLVNLSKTITDCVNNDFYIFETVKSMALTKLYLEQKQINYYFLNACNNVNLKNIKTNDPYVETFKNIAAQANWLDAPSFYNWAHINDYKIGFGNHPLEPAHQAYFEEFIKSKVNV